MLKSASCNKNKKIFKKIFFFNFLYIYTVYIIFLINNNLIKISLYIYTNIFYKNTNPSLYKKKCIYQNIVQYLTLSKIHFLSIFSPMTMVWCPMFSMFMHMLMRKPFMMIHSYSSMFFLVSSKFIHISTMMLC